MEQESNAPSHSRVTFLPNRLALFSGCLRTGLSMASGGLTFVQDKSVRIKSVEMASNLQKTFFLIIILPFDKNDIQEWKMSE